MSRIIKTAHIQAANPEHEGSVEHIKQAMIEKHLKMIDEAGQKDVQKLVFIFAMIVIFQNWRFFP